MRDAMDAVCRGILGCAAFDRPRPRLLLQRFIRIGQLVGNDESGEQQQPSFADLTEGADEFGDLRVDILSQAPDTRLLSIVAGERERMAVDRDTDLAHLSPLTPTLDRSGQERRRRARRFAPLSLAAAGSRLRVRQDAARPASRSHRPPRAGQPPVRAARWHLRAGSSGNDLPSEYLLEVTAAAHILRPG